MLARIRKATEDKDQGFTLIELLVVMIIIGILAAIAVPTFMNQRRNGQKTAIKSDLRNAMTAVESWSVDRNGTYDTLTSAMLAPGTANIGFQASNDVVVVVAGIAPTLGTAPTVNSYCLVGYHNALGGTTSAPADQFTVRRHPTDGWSEPKPVSSHPCP